MKCNYNPPKLTKEERQDMVSIKSTLPYIDRLQINWRNREMENKEIIYHDSGDGKQKYYIR